MGRKGGAEAFAAKNSVDTVAPLIDPPRAERGKKLIKRAVLVLNKNYIPCYVTNLRHAFSLLFREVAYVLDEDNYTYDIWNWIDIEPVDGEEYISTVSRKIRIPKIIIAETDVEMRFNRPKISRLGIFMRDAFCCQYCGRRFSQKGLTIDHVIPRSRGGKTDWTNVVTACVACNMKKGDRTPDEAGMMLIREPRVPFINILNTRDIDLVFYAEWEPFIPR